MSGSQTFFKIRDYDLAATLTSGQAFRWRLRASGWEGVVRGRWVRLQQANAGISAETVEIVPDWDWLKEYLQIEFDLESVVQTFPKDEAMHAALRACRGLRLLRQEPWECLASFILSSTKQIVQIQQIVDSLCRCFGVPVPVPPGNAAEFAFPTVERIACATEAGLRACKMGFRAPNLLASARMVAAGEVDLHALHDQDCATARARLLRLPGVGDKIANCVLLFAYGFQDAFPVDVWVRKALLQLYFPRRRPSAQRLLNFTRTYFGQNAGYAQQYLFHYMRMHGRSLRKKSVEKQPRKAAD